VREENLALIERLIKVQDDERRQIARDLHDEAGPCLFSIRAGASTLLRDTSQPGFDLDRIRNTCREVNAAGQALQDLILRMLDQLRPPGLSELGLEAAVRGLIANWQEARPDVALVLETPHHLDSVSGAVGLTAYRVIQESLTNIYRHASASKARVRLEFENAPLEEGYGHSDAVSSVLRITVEDNGIGISGHRGKGSGLAGMNERVQALKGCISVTGRPGGGTCVNVVLPLLDEDGKES
jgi:two-component system sensor histidine kinase UhpB